MDDLNFNKDEVIVMNGTFIPDFPLSEILTEHYLTGATLTSAVKEVDLTQKPKVVQKSEEYDIYLYGDIPKNTLLPSEK